MPRTGRFDRLMLDLGCAVGDLRRVRGWSPERFARRSPVTFSTVLDIERGKRDLRASTLVGLMDTLEVSPEEILAAVRVARERNARLDGVATQDATKGVA
jgi:transcriptional regulator with XRE-family HTH domain